MNSDCHDYPVEQIDDMLVCTGCKTECKARPKKVYIKSVIKKPKLADEWCAGCDKVIKGWYTLVYARGKAWHSKCLTKIK